MLENIIHHNDCHNAPLFSDKLQQVVRIVMAEMEEEERDAKYNANNVTMENFFNRSIISPSQGDIAKITSVNSTIPPSQEYANVTNKRQIASDILKETIK